MGYKKLISVGNDEKGYALFDTYNGEFLSEFDYSSIIVSNYGLNFLFDKSGNCKIVNNSNEELTFDKNYLWTTLSNSNIGVAGVFNKLDGKCYLGNYKGEILSKGYNGTILPSAFKSGLDGLFNIVVKDVSAGKVYKGLLSLTGEELVAPVDEYLPVYDDIFVLSELIERYGFGLLNLASDELLVSGVAGVKLFESALKYIYNVPNSVDQETFRQAYCYKAPGLFVETWLDLVVKRNLTRPNLQDYNLSELATRFGTLISGIKKDFDGKIANLYLSSLGKNVFDALERLGIRFNYNDIKAYL